MKLYEAMMGFQLIPDPDLVLARQVRFPRSKRYRIRLKWSLRKENNVFSANPNLIYSAERKIVIGHPATILALRKKIAASYFNAHASGEIPADRSESIRAALDLEGGN